MACPECGGSDREAIAPGYWRCRSSVTRHGTQQVPAPWAPPHTGITMAMAVTWQEPCTEQYQEQDGTGAPPVPCSRCSTYAIGLCSDCATPVCGLHSSMYGDRRRCPEDAAEARSRDEAAAARAMAATAEREAAERAAHEALWNPRAAAKRRRAAQLGPGGGWTKAERREHAEAQHRAARNRERLAELRSSDVPDRLAAVRETQRRAAGNASPAPSGQTFGGRLRKLFR